MIDLLIPGPHTPFKEISRRALAYRLRQLGLDVQGEAVRAVIGWWKALKPYPDVDAALARLDETYSIVGLSNGNPNMLSAVRPNFETQLDGVISVAEAVRTGLIVLPTTSVVNGSASRHTRSYS